MSTMSSTNKLHTLTPEVLNSKRTKTTPVTRGKVWHHWFANECTVKHVAEGTECPKA